MQPRSRVVRYGSLFGARLWQAGKSLIRGNAGSAVERGSLVAWGVVVRIPVTAERVEVVELLGVAALTSLAVGVALIVDRRAVSRAVKELVSTERVGVASPAVRLRASPLLADVVRLGGVRGVEERTLGLADAGQL